jgi:hypothetical protein
MSWVGGCDVAASQLYVVIYSKSLSPREDLLVRVSLQPTGKCLSCT